MAGEGGREGGGVHQLLVQLWVRKKNSLLKFFDVCRSDQYFVYVCNVFFQPPHGLPARHCVLNTFLQKCKNLQNRLEAGKSERQGNALVPEKPLIILNAVSTWTKLKKTTLQWQVLIMQSKMLATNQTCLPDCWWNFLRIIEPQVQQLQRTLSFFKLFVPKLVSGKRRHTK